jgi:hypothetical protein
MIDLPGLMLIEYLSCETWIKIIGINKYGTVNQAIEQRLFQRGPEPLANWQSEAFFPPLQKA